MKTLVIHPRDTTTDFLNVVYVDKNYSLINNNVSKKVLKYLIKEHDRIIMMGHGTEKGLICGNRLIIDSKLVYLLREKICVCIWCNANLFVEKYNLKGFFSGMIISKIDEAYDHGFNVTYEEIEGSNNKLALSLSKYIDSDDILNNIFKFYNGESPIIQFNRNNLFNK